MADNSQPRGRTTGLLRMCVKLLLGGGPRGIANLQLLQSFLRNNQ